MQDETYNPSAAFKSAHETLLKLGGEGDDETGSRGGSGSGSDSGSGSGADTGTGVSEGSVFGGIGVGVGWAGRWSDERMKVRFHFLYLTLFSVVPTPQSTELALPNSSSCKPSPQPPPASPKSHLRLSRSSLRSTIRRPWCGTRRSLVGSRTRARASNPRLEDMLERSAWCPVI